MLQSLLSILTNAVIPTQIAYSMSTQHLIKGDTVSRVMRPHARAPDLPYYFKPVLLCAQLADDDDKHMYVMPLMRAVCCMPLNARKCCGLTHFGS